MAPDLEKDKQIVADQSKQAGVKRTIQGKLVKWGFANRYPQLAQFKTGLQDIVNAIMEKKFPLFAKQVIVLAVVILLAKAINAKLVSKKAQIKNDIAAIHMQQNSKEEYLSNKEHLLRLEPLFPDIDKKSGWMPSMLMELFGRHDLSPVIDGNFVENVQKTYSVVSQNISWQQSYRDLGGMLEDLENGNAFLRVSEVSISKLTGKEELGSNDVTIKFNTVFPKVKYAPLLFRDYKQQMEKIQAEQEASGRAASANAGEAK